MRHLKSPCFVAAAVLMLGACSDASDRPLTGPVGPRLALLGPLSAGHLALQAEFTPLLNSVYACADATQNRKYTDALKKIDKYAREGDFARVAVAVEELIQNTESLLSSGKLATDCAGFDPDAAEQAFALLRLFAGIEGENEAVAFCEAGEECVATVPGDDGAELVGTFGEGVILSIIKKLDGWGPPNGVGNAWTFQCFGPSGELGCDPPDGITKKICAAFNDHPEGGEVDENNIFIATLITPETSERFATIQAGLCTSPPPSPDFLGMLPANPLLRSVHQAAATLSTFFLPKPLYATHIRGHYYANSGEPPTGLSDWSLEHHLPTTIATCATPDLLSHLAVNGEFDFRAADYPFTSLQSITVRLSTIQDVTIKARRITPGEGDKDLGEPNDITSVAADDAVGGFVVTATWPTQPVKKGGEVLFDVSRTGGTVSIGTTTTTENCPFETFGDPDADPPVPSVKVAGTLVGHAPAGN